MSTPCTSSALCALLLCASANQLCRAADAMQPRSEASPGIWREHEYVFHFLGVTSTYSCDGLGEQLRRLLRETGARADARVTPLCSLGPNKPDRLAQAQLRFWSLVPSKSASPGSPLVPGVWWHIQWRQTRGQSATAAGPGCELVQEFSNVVLPLFTTRDQHSDFSCTPNQASSFTLSFDVFRPAPNDREALKSRS